jgi:dTDP-4-dehydrorhamnose 3,5-epimerase
MKIFPTRLDGVFVIEPLVHKDNRGFFTESFNSKELEQQGLHYSFIQDNHSLSVESGVLRGLHYQLNPKAQTKLIRVLTGVIYDVVLDIRKNSSTFGEWIFVILSEFNKRQLLVPKGFAHGFCTVVPNTQVLYKVDEYYSPKDDRGVFWNDPDLNIQWPTSNPIISEKDKLHPQLKNAEINF